MLALTAFRAKVRGTEDRAANDLRRQRFGALARHPALLVDGGNAASCRWMMSAVGQ
jgi:hypothetical protein